MAASHIVRIVVSDKDHRGRSPQEADPVRRPVRLSKWRAGRRDWYCDVSLEGDLILAAQEGAAQLQATCHFLLLLYSNCTQTTDDPDPLL